MRVKVVNHKSGEQFPIFLDDPKVLEISSDKVLAPRLFSEVAWLPYQKLAFDDEGQAFIEYFPTKASRGEVFTPKCKLYIPTAMVSIIKDVFAELEELTATPRSADCKDYVWVKDDKGCVDELIRQYVVTTLARQTAARRS